MSVTLLAYDIPRTIRIGLESIAKDVSSIEIKSEEDLVIGYFIEDRWYEEGVLDTSEVTVKLATDTYYMYEESFRRYEDAYSAVSNYGEDAVVSYIEPGEYRIYTSYEGYRMEAAGRNEKRIAVYDKRGKLILISENNRGPLGFQGGYGKYDFPATGVGSDRLYRGVVEIVKGQYKGLTAVSVVDFEEYIYGVVNNEMGGSNPLEALKAQAVVARSMAVYQYSRYVSRGYNLVDTTYSQVYKGITSEHGNTTRAVDETRGELALYNGKVAETIYGSSSGGHTENAKYVWGNDVPYLQGVKDTYEENNHDWTRTITLEDMEKCLKDDNIDIGRVEGMQIVEWTPSGRVRELRILGSKGYHTLTKEMPRTFFHKASGGSLKSTMYKFTPYDGSEEWGSGSSGGNNLGQVKEVFILSSTGAVVTELDGLRAEGKDEIMRLSEDNPIYILSKNGVTNNNPSGSKGEDKPFNPGNEKTTVYGDVTLYGKGYGHGVGMSQNGAIAMAKKGYTYDKIIEFYYPGVVVR